jgi:hypothetical protein
MQESNKFSIDPFTLMGFQQRSHIRQALKYMDRHFKISGKVLDVGAFNPLTAAMQHHFNVKIDNTIGNLDEQVSAPGKDYDRIIYSHVMEHQMNPLFTLCELKKLMKDDALMLIGLPRRGKLLWTKGHFHEIDEYRFRELIRVAGMVMIHRKIGKSCRHPLTYFTGIRPILRLFFEFNVTYILKKELNEGIGRNHLPELRLCI